MSRITKLFFIAFVFSLTVFMTHESLAVGFSKGNSFTTQPISGNVTVFCQNNNGYPPGGGGFTDIQHVSCRAELWSPAIRDYFVGPQGVVADKVKLIATHADGSTRDKESDYDSAAGKSEKDFNLGIGTVFQRPLLKKGTNNVRYILSLNGQTVSEGNFTATVGSVPGAQCPSSSYHTPIGFSCQNSMSVCDQYFAEHNYCQ